MTTNITSYVPAYAGGESVTLSAPNIAGSNIGQNFTGPNDILIGTGAGTFTTATMGDILSGAFSNIGGPIGYSYNDLALPVASIDANNQNIINLLDPINAQDAATKSYVDSAVAGPGSFLPLSGGTMTGAIEFSNSGNNIRLDPATPSIPSLAFVGDPNTGMYSAGSGSIDFTNANFLSGPFFSMEPDGTLNVAGQTDYELQVTDDDDIPNKKYVDDAIVSGTSGLYLPTAGGTMTGSILLAAGTEAVPSLSFDGEPGLGLYKSATDEISFVNATLLNIPVLTIKSTGEISVPAGYEFLVTTDDVLTNKAYVDNAIINDGGNLYLALAGGQMTGDITFSNTQSFPYDNTGSGLAATNLQDAVTELDQDISNVANAYVVSVFGRDGVVTAAPGDYSALDIIYNNSTSGLTAVNVQNAIDELDGVVDGLVSAGPYLELAGGTMTGVISFAGGITTGQVFPYDPGFSPGNALTATDMQGAIDELEIRVSNNETDLSTGPFLPLTGGGLTGSLFLNSDPTATLEAATKQYVDNEITNLNIGSYLPLAGGTMTGDILGLTTLTVGDHVLGANDYQSNLGGFSFLITTSASSSASAPTYSFVGATDMGMYSTGAELRMSVGGVDRISLLAGSGVSMNGNVVSNVADPVNDQDAATKKWVTDMNTVRLLGSALSVDLTAGAGTGTTILSVPVGRRHMYTQLAIRARSYNPGGSPTNPSIEVGNQGTYNDVLGTTILNWGSGGSADQVIVIPLGVNGSPSITPNPGSTIDIRIVVPAGFTELLVDVHLIGMEVSA